MSSDIPRLKKAESFKEKRQQWWVVKGVFALCVLAWTVSLLSRFLTS